MLRNLFIFAFTFLIVLPFYAQDKKAPVDYDKAFLITPVFSFQIPAAEMAHRYGVSTSFGMSFDYKFAKNWMVGMEGNFMFGKSVKQSGILENVLASNGMAITRTGELAEINLGVRGAALRYNTSKIFNFRDSKPNNGLMLKLGIGYLMHKMVIDAGKDAVPQLSGDYVKGYDRFTHGLVVSQFIGLIKLERGKFVNLYGGIEAMQGITKSGRAWDFYQAQKLDKTRFDFMIGFKVGWMIPVFLGESSASEYYYY